MNNEKIIIFFFQMKLSFNVPYTSSIKSALIIIRRKKKYEHKYGIDTKNRFTAFDILTVVYVCEM